jgi:predicted PurR-regulated permease PerM
MPIVGQTAAERWNSLTNDAAMLKERAKTYIEPVSAWLMRMGLKLGSGLVQLAVSVLLTFLILRRGGAIGEVIMDSIERISGERGKRLLLLAGVTVRGVVYGILGTAIAQAVMAWIGFAVAGVPGAALLALFMFFLSAVPLGPPILWLPAALWLFHQGATGWGVFMLIWGMGVSMLDNVVKPWLISQGSAMTFLLILFGVVGGAMMYGFIGVFLGPTLLAVGYRLVGDWSTASRGYES